MIPVVPYTFPSLRMSDFVSLPAETLSRPRNFLNFHLDGGLHKAQLELLNGGAISEAAGS